MSAREFLRESAIGASQGRSAEDAQAIVAVRRVEGSGEHAARPCDDALVSGTTRATDTLPPEINLLSHHDDRFPRRLRPTSPLATPASSLTL